MRAAVGYGPTGARVDDVAVAFSPDDEAAQIISGGGDALTGDADAAGGGAGTARIFETDVPGGTTGRSAEGAEVVAKINERAGDAVVERELRDDIDGVFFAEPTEVEGHAGRGKKDAAGRALHFFPADERTGGGDLGGVGDAGRLSLVIPETNQRERRRIEHALGHEVQRVAKFQQTFHLGVDVDPVATGGGIDAADETICAKTGIFGFEGGDPGNSGALERHGLIVAGGGSVVDFALRAEGGKRELPQRQRVGRSGRSGRRGAVLLSDDGHEGGDGREI